MAKVFTFMNQRIEDILRDYRRIEAISHAQRVLHWDLEVMMPEGGIDHRSESLANIEILQREFYLRLAEKVNSVEGDLDDIEKGIIRNLKRTIRYYSLPEDLIKRIEKITTKAPLIWREARKKSDFSMFEPSLREIVSLSREVAEKLGYERHPYNALMDLYEEGFTVDDANIIFSRILNETSRIMKKIEGTEFYGRHPLEQRKYRKESMEKVNREIIKILGMPEKRFRMDVSAHPFTIGISMDDVRITTRYEGINFKSTLFSTVHESGHAIYELQKDPSLAWTPVSRAPSLGFHESQSRFFENIVGRSREFVHLIYPVLRENLSFINKYSEDEIYNYFNMVHPSLIRVDADEVTYNLHIALRYEIEKGLIEGSIDTKDLPGIWNSFMDKYLGIVPENDSQGVLQDIHWSQGSFGYFPTYTLGNVISAIIRGRFDNLSNLIAEGNIIAIRDYLREKVHRYGSIYTPKELLRISFGEGYNPEYLLKYLEEKFS
ncbi:MAG: carboxypeptidase M32 [Thermoplasmata archaeon]|jgi:carboxypeptidase Taq